MIQKIVREEKIMDELLNRFHFDVMIHEQAIQHALDKGGKLNDVNVLFQPESFDIITAMIKDGNYVTLPCERKYVDKETGEHISYRQAMMYKEQGKKVRELNVLPFLDRVICNCFYQILYDRFEYMIHPRCVSYRKCVGTGKIGKQLTSELVKLNHYTGYKCDLSKFFDTVPIEEIDKLFDNLESQEPSAIWKVIRQCYHDDRIYINGELTECFQSLKQGNSLAALWADIILRDIDEAMCQYNIIYFRYSDDVLILSDDEKESKQAFDTFRMMLREKGLTLNEKKTERISDRDWFEFLGFSFKKDMRSISSKTLRNLRIKIKETTMSKTRKAHKPATKTELRKAIKELQRFFFTAFADNQENFGMGVYLFGSVNVEHDLIAIENYCKDCLRAMITNKSNIYGLGYVHRNNYVIDDKNIGQNVKANKEKTNAQTDDDILRECGWVSLMKMYNDYHTNKDLFENSVYRMSVGLF